MDYAFGEQAYETMDELLKPYMIDGKRDVLNVESISIMGKAGILKRKERGYYDPERPCFRGYGR